MTAATLYPRAADLGSATSVRTTFGNIVVHERGSGPALIFLHGIFANSDLWGDVVDDLADSYRCVCIDLPLGAHLSAAAPDADISPEGMAALVLEIIPKLTSLPPVVVANDTGGAIAQLAVAQDPEAFAGLVLTSCDAFSNFLPISLRYTQAVARIPGGMWLVTQLLRSGLIRSLPIAFGRLTRSTVRPELLDSFLLPSRRDSAIRRDLGKFLTKISGRRLMRASSELARFDKPVLLPWADTKHVFPVAHAHRLAALFPHARVEVIDDCRAFVPIDQPAALAGLIDGFHQEFPTMNPPR